MDEDQSAMANLYGAKKQLRHMMRERLSAIPPESILSQSSAMFNSLRNLKHYQEAKRISVFLSMPTGEIQTDAIVRHALWTGKEVFVPHLHRDRKPLPNQPARVMDMVRLKDVADYETLKRDNWGIPTIEDVTVNKRQRVLGEPDAADMTDLDLILMPGLAFDRDFLPGSIRRLGHGKAFYDYFISRYIARASSLGYRTNVTLIGLALSEQFLTSAEEGFVPVGPLDHRLHGLILGGGRIIGPSVPTVPT